MKLNVRNDGIDFGTNILKVKVPKELRNKCATGLDYIDTTLGGQGFTPSMVTLFTGTPGAGKTTMMLLMANSLVRQGALVVFNTAEESLHQVKMVVERLKTLDRVAYIRFASVYRDFRDIESFKEEIDALLEPREDTGVPSNQLSFLEDESLPPRQRRRRGRRPKTSPNDRA